MCEKRQSLLCPSLKPNFFLKIIIGRLKVANSSPKLNGKCWKREENTKYGLGGNLNIPCPSGARLEWQFRLPNVKGHDSTRSGTTRPDCEFVQSTVDVNFQLQTTHEDISPTTLYFLLARYSQRVLVESMIPCGQNPEVAKNLQCQVTDCTV